MSNVLELIYQTQDNQLFLLLVIAMFLILIAIIYVVHAQSKVRKVTEKEEVEEPVNYNIYSEQKEEENKPGLLEQMVEESKEEKVLIPEIEEDFDLKNVTKELESLPKERTITLTPYELEQEEQAIISYDELVTQSIPKLEISEALREEVLTDYEYDVDKKYEDNVPKLEQMGETNSVVRAKDNYVHEESFLDDLKNLKNSLN